MKHIPNLITSLNMVSGFAAVIFAARGDVIRASWLIVAAMIFDFFDGFSARLLKSYSGLGKELDSLADVVSFGVAPAVIIFHLLSNAVSPDPMVIMSENAWSALLICLPAIMPVFAALRLAKFNIDPAQSTIFRGLPTPANAIAVITLVLALDFSGSDLLKTLINSPAFLLAYTIVLSILMVSRIRLFSLKMRSFEFRGNEGPFLLLMLVVAAYAIFGSGSVLMIIPFYIIASLVHFGLNKNSGRA